MSLGMALLLGYLLGSLPFAVIVSRLFGLADPRSFGSGNPGATNVLRAGNKLAAALTLLGDGGKGLLAMFLAAQAGADDWIMAMTGLGAMLGHIYPFTLNFKGGKGVATALGVMFGISWLLGAALATVWLAVAYLTRYSSLAALSAAASAPLIALALGEKLATVLIIVAISLLLVKRHRNNIINLFSGTESRIGEKTQDS
ncbi:MAG: acyl-phosphate glycerol 3-phosphate acyltransferase [Betaproteobacteria bacterium HGW-Betaproteobacteria-11]|nr:MAG: acyl-phosphate glycerol 3-phosphate acyltransferase [Betaproteobacteria bacterium HGW-Betaproteobacteria-11]